jgi:Endodeoxyribonuclease RusA
MYRLDHTDAILFVLLIAIVTAVGRNRCSSAVAFSSSVFSTTSHSSHHRSQHRRTSHSVIFVRSSPRGGGLDVQGRSKHVTTASSSEAQPKSKPKRSPAARGNNLPGSVNATVTGGREKRSKKASAPTLRGVDDGPWHWMVESDDFLLEYTHPNQNSPQRRDAAEEEEETKRPVRVRLKVRGNPRPLRRHRSGNGHVYNPSSKYQHSFQKVVEGLLFRGGRHGGSPIDEGGFEPRGQLQAPLFEAHEHLAMGVVFRMKRPRNHFINSKPGPDRLKANSPPRLSPIRTDVDNLTKFVLDSMNGILYHDDRQIMSIHVTKLLDDEDLCGGSTEIHLRSVEAGDLESIVVNALAVVGGNRR